MTRALQTRSSRCEFEAVPNEAREEMSCWVDCLQEYNSQPVWNSPSAVRCVHLDASDTGYEGYAVVQGMHIALVA